MAVFTTAPRVRRVRRLHSATSLGAATPAQPRPRCASAPASPGYRRVPRPATALPMPRNILDALEPSLAHVPVKYIREKLLARGSDMYRTSQTATAKLNHDTLPAEVEITLHDNSAPAPTHMIAVWTKEASLCKQPRMELFPVHGLVLATTCSTLPPHLAKTSTYPHDELIPDDSSKKVTIPVIPMRLPSQETFAILLAFLYTRRPDFLLKSLIPTKQTPTWRMDMARSVRGVWQNAMVLGVQDPKFYQTLDLAMAITQHVA